MNRLAKWLRAASNLFSEKPQVQVDEFGLEHFLLYHGLVGSSPENQREFKDVRADIFSAVSRGNSHVLCINIKLAPLWWEDKLYRIFEELKESRAAETAATLLPDRSGSEDYEVHDYDPLRHQDWRVKANAALVLAKLKEAGAEAPIIRALHATAGTTTPAFCHISRALANYRSDAAREALSTYLQHDEPWIRVDAVNALAHWPLAEVATPVARSFKQHHDFLDYAAVAFTRHHKPEEILQHEDGEFIDLGAALTVSLIDAATGTFSNHSSKDELLSETGLDKCIPVLLKAVEADPRPVRVRALRNLAGQLEDLAGAEEALSAGKSGELRKRIIGHVETAALKPSAAEIPATEKPAEGGSASKSSELRHALKLVGELELSETKELLIALLTGGKAEAHRDEIIEAMGKLGDPDFAEPLVALTNKLVNLEDRCSRPLSPSPVAERDPDAARSYWYILRALGNIPDRRAFDLLIKSTRDYAADKREEALASAINLWQLAFVEDRTALADISEAVLRSLGDPSTQVKIKALSGTQALGRRSSNAEKSARPTETKQTDRLTETKMAEIIPNVAKLITAQEISLARAALEAIELLAQNGQTAAVKEALGEIKRSHGQLGERSKKIDELLTRLG